MKKSFEGDLQRGLCLPRLEIPGATSRMIRDCEEAAVNAADEPGCAPSDLLNLMTAWRAQIGLQLKGDLQVEGGQHLTRDELQQGMKSIIDILLDQNQQLVCCLAELEREAVKRTVQMQKRLQSTANTTRETVHKMSEWGEEIQTIISKKHLAEEAALESKYMVADLQKENRQLRNYNDNLYSDVQSLLSIINVARTTGNWEMDCVTFCVISPEEVYGPICHLSAQNTDGMATMDGKPDTLQSPETECAINFSESLPAMFTEWHESVAIQEAPKSVKSFLCSSTCKVKSRNVRRRLVFDTAKKLSAPKHNARYKHLGASPVKSKSAAAKSCAEVGTQTFAVPPTVEDMCTQVNLSSALRKLDQNKASSHIHPLLVHTDDQRKSSHTNMKSECPINLSESVPAMFTVWDESVAIQDAPKSVKSFLRSSTCKVKSRNVRRRLVFDSAKKLSVPKLNSHYKHLGASPVKRDSAAMKAYAEVSAQTYSGAATVAQHCADVGTQTFATPPTLKEIGTQVDLSSSLMKNEQNESSATMLLLTGDEKKSTAMMSTQTDVEWETCLPSGNETRDQELCSLKDRLALAIQEAQSKALLAMELQVHLDMSAKEVELRDQVVSNLEKKLSAARQETDHLKKQLTSVECELESVKRISQKEKAETELCKSELEKMAVTVKHLQDALVEYKKNGAAASPTVLPKVHDV
ncbi:uncharacterized protein LOC119378193 isoform X3 [Rhipicephalus sanguineus]|uniref:uncharacterized protein LOC119378193 isoform X3 n=1 Tax=Rhipicephalus sanguineus TaxID=34632 RepID=UPI001893C207|nr:uncharacterized protein LOC119378193 isoform X3 [Rhipicephalus sanguineus]